MKKHAIVLTTCLGGFSLPSSAATIWAENFEAATLGSTSGNNAALAGTVIETANTLTSEVVTAPGAFTLASGNAILLSTGDNDFSAIRPIGGGGGIALSGISAGDIWTLAFDIYIPTDLDATVGGIASFRWKDGAANNGNGPADLTGETLTAGEYHIVYTGTFPLPAQTDPGVNPDYIPTSVRPFINFDQKINGADDGTTSEFVYVDNIEFTIDSIPEPGSTFLLALGGLACFKRRR